MKKGTIVSCPDCKKPLLECIDDIPLGTREWPKYYKNLEWKGSVGDPGECACGATFFTCNGMWVEGIGYTFTGVAHVAKLQMVYEFEDLADIKENPDELVFLALKRDHIAALQGLHVIPGSKSKEELAELIKELWKE